MTTFDDLVNEVLLTLNGYGLAQPRAAFLDSAITETDLTIPVTSVANFSQGIAELGDELVFVETVDSAANTLTVSPDGRGYYGTAAAAHAAGTRVEASPTWPRLRIRLAINDVITGTYPTLFGVAATSFTFNPTQTTYSLPEDAERVLAVSADTIGPSREQQHVRRYSFNSVAPVGEFATTNSVTLQEAVAPGRDVTVTYMKQPSELVSGDDFTDSGLRQSAKAAVIFGACSQLISYMDAARLPVDTAQADAYDERNSVGRATQIGTQLYQRYELELEKERKRLRATTPVAINVRTR